MTDRGLPSPDRAVPRTNIHVISLTSATERRARFEASMPETIEWQFFDACTALDPALHYDERRALIDGGRALGPSELACYSSHFRLWQQLIDDPDADRYLVLEDDVIIDWLFVERLCELGTAELDLPFLRLFFMQAVPTRTVAIPFLDIYQIVELLDFGFGAQAYLVDKAAAARFVAALRDVIQPVDTSMEVAWRHGVRNLAVFPFPVIHPMVPSQIGGARWDARAKPLWIKVMRGSARIRAAVRKRLWQLGARRH